MTRTMVSMMALVLSSVLLAGCTQTGQTRTTPASTVSPAVGDIVSVSIDPVYFGHGGCERVDISLVDRTLTGSGCTEPGADAVHALEPSTVESFRAALESSGIRVWEESYSWYDHHSPGLLADGDWYVVVVDYGSGVQRSTTVFLYNPPGWKTFSAAVVELVKPFDLDLGMGFA